MSRVQSLASIPTHHGLTAQQKITADQIISCMENNDPILPYAYHEVLNDGRGITCGRSGFTSANGDLLAVIERYTQFSPNNPLTKYLPALTRAAEHESDDVRELVGFEKDWVECVTRDPNLCRAQDDVNDREYYIPSAKIADELGLRLPLSRTVIYDTYIQHGIDPDDNWTKDKDFKDDMDHIGQLIREARRQCGGLPSHNVPERVFLRTFLEVRKKHLLHSADPETRREWRDSVDRIAAFQRLLDAGHVDLVLPLRLIVFDERFYLESDPTKSRKLKPGESFPGTMGLLSNGCGFSSMFSWSIAKFGSFDNETKATQPPSKPNAAAILSQHGQSTVGRLTLSSQAPSASMATIPVFSRTEQSQTPVSSIFDVKEDGPYLGHLTTQQKLTMEQITSCFVHGNKQMQYDACMDIGDGRGLICGRCGSFTSASGTLLHLVERYTTIVPSNPLQRYITILRLLSEAESGETDQLTGFELDWKQVCKDPQMAQIQDELCDRELFIPVCLRADQLGLRSPLAHAILYDTLLEHGGGRSHDSMESIIRHVQREKGVPQPSLDEVRWLRRFLERRRKHMEHPHDHRKRRYWSHCVERLHVFLRMLDHHQMDLSLPLTIRYHGEVYVLERDESLEETTPSRNTRILRPTSHTNGNGHTTHINGTNGGLTIQQKRIAEQLISCFENASPEVQYAYAEDLNDGRGLTCGRCGFTSAHGDLLLVVERYNELSPNNILTKYLPALRSLAKHEDDDTTQLRGFLKDWKVAVQDVNLIQAQDDINDQEYYSVSVRYSDILGLKLPISRAQLYDALIQHGANEDDDLTSEVDDEEDPDSLSQLIRETRHKMKGTPATGVDELTWLRAFLDVRKKHLNNAHLPEARNEWRASIDRVDCFIRLLNENNINLASPLQVTVFGESFTLSA